MNKTLFTLIFLSSIPFSNPANTPIDFSNPQIIQNYSDDLKILTWNVYMLPSIASLSKEIGNTQFEKRAHEISKYLLKSNYDCIILEEVFNKKCYEILKKCLSKKYPFISQPFNNNHLIKANSGLMFLSKFKIQEYKTIQFNDCASSDCLSNKGAFKATMIINQKIINIIGTHLQAEYNQISEFNHIRINQLKQIVEKFEIDFNNTNCTNIYCGDFNVSQNDTAHYNEMIKLLQVENKIPKNCNYSWTPYNGKTTEKHLYDYCLINQNGYKKEYSQLIISDIEKHFTIKPSDHFPLEMTLSLKQHNFIAENTIYK